MGLTRILVRTAVTFNSNTESRRDITYSIDGKTVSQEEYQIALDQKCLHTSHKRYFDSGPVIPEGRSSENTLITKQYLPFCPLDL